MEHPNTPHSGTIVNTIIAALFWIIGGIFKAVSILSADALYEWTFRILSLISVAFIIIINYPKVKETLNNRKKRKDGNN